jgi:hypothetical protein
VLQRILQHLRVLKVENFESTHIGNYSLHHRLLMGMEQCTMGDTEFKTAHFEREGILRYDNSQSKAVLGLGSYRSLLMTPAEIQQILWNHSLTKLLLFTRDTLSLLVLGRI